ncbi:MAG TPA: hypothetical protein VMV90_06295 [Rectinemataceae bacterium]|nr:hypothetical protein [Rectinemataceae bacterium]
MSTRAPILRFAFFALVIAGGPALRAANFAVNNLEMVTHGSVDPSTNLFTAGTSLYYELEIKGGDKVSALLRLNFLNGDIENVLPTSGTLSTALSPQFETAAVTAKDIFNLPLDATYFVGYMDAFCSGDDFVSLFGTAPFATTLRGPMVYPDGIGNNPNRYWDGIAASDGTGFRLGTSPRLSSNFVSYLYLYQDSDIGPGSWSGDLRGLMNYERVKLEIFAGATATPGSGYGVYRSGLMFYAAPGEVGEFFAQVGVPHWDPLAGFSVNDIFFLFEPRMNFSFGSLALTVFYHPAWYRQQPTDESGALDTALDLRFGKIAQDGSQGGLQGLLEFRPLTTNTTLTPTLTALASPYYSIIGGGIEWDFKLGLQLLPLPSVWYAIFQPFVGLQTSF